MNWDDTIYHEIILFGVIFMEKNTKTKTKKT